MIDHRVASQRNALLNQSGGHIRQGENFRFWKFQRSFPENRHFRRIRRPVKKLLENWKTSDHLSDCSGVGFFAGFFGFEFFDFSNELCFFFFQKSFDCFDEDRFFVVLKGLTVEEAEIDDDGGAEFFRIFFWLEAFFDGFLVIRGIYE